MLNERASGVLLHISSLPSKYGIGCFDKCAYDFVDFLQAAGQTYWQILPLCPTTIGDSPYQSISTFALNEYFIDLDALCRLELLKKEEFEDIEWFKDKNKVDYSLLYTNRHRVLYKAFDRFKRNIPNDFNLFCKENLSWLDDYSLFCAVKDYFGAEPFYYWNDDIKYREIFAVEEFKEICKDRILYYKMIQYFLFSQWQAIRKYANKRGISIIGDMPIYVANDSADVWANKELFKLDSKGYPLEVAGVPPDYFSATGQLWGNPLYDWDAMKDDGYRWWIERVRNQLDQVDYIRIDHFRGFEAYWAVPAGEKTAMNGKWKKGPGEALFEAIQKALGEELPIFAEDLGIITPEVEKLRDTLGFPGMKILQFGFDGTGESTFLPHQLSTRNCICYTGTHDNDTTCGWDEHTNEQNKDKVRRYMNTDASSVSWDFIRTCLGTIAKYAIFPVQDLLKLGSEHRMNTPGTATGNWEFRYRSGLLDEGMAKGLKQMTELFGRWG